MDADKLQALSVLIHKFSQMQEKILSFNELCASHIRKYRERRRRLHQRIAILQQQQHQLVCSLLNPPKRFKKKRKRLFWEHDVVAAGEAAFKTHFRMTRDNFNILCTMLRGLEKKDTNYRRAIAYEKRVAIAVYALGSSAEYRKIANLFGVGKSTVCVLLLEFCEEAWNILRPQCFNYFPLTSEKVQANIDGFMALGFPQCIGALDGCHIEVRTKTQYFVDYLNNKGWHSMVLLALVDHRYRFLYVNIGSPGRFHDSQIFEESFLKKILTQSPNIWTNSKEIGEQNVPALVIADSGFQAAPYLMKPYRFDVNAHETHKAFNDSLSTCHRFAKTAFDHLKARFRRIGKGLDNHVHRAPLIIKVCCALHNFLNERNDAINEKWMKDLSCHQLKREQPDQPEIMDSNADAMRIRDAIASFIRDSTLSNDLTQGLDADPLV